MDIRHQLERAHIKPDKKSGQNFLLSESILEFIAEAAELKADDWVLEIGSGPGNLTVQLAERAGHVWAVEPDKRLLPVLTTSIHPFRKKVEIIADDIFKWRNAHRDQLGQQPYKVVANLPYYLTSRVLREFLEAPPKPVSLVLLVQKEVAERMTAPPGEMSLLSVSVQLYSDAEIVFDVGREAFWPEPAVDSAVVRLTNLRPTQPNDTNLFRMAKMAFAGRRKQLHNTLSAGLRMKSDVVTARLAEISIDSAMRPQELSLDQWKNIAQLFAGE